MDQKPGKEFFNRVAGVGGVKIESTAVRPIVDGLAKNLGTNPGGPSDTPRNDRVGSASGSFGTTGGATGGADPNETTIPIKRRGRKPGPTPTAPPSQGLVLSVGELANHLERLHAVVAVATQTVELVISKGEAEILAGAMLEVNKHYPVNVNPKHVAIFGLISTMIGIYGVRFKQIVKKAEAAKRPVSGATPQHQSNIVDFPNPGSIFNPAAQPVQSTATPVASADNPFVPPMESYAAPVSVANPRGVAPVPEIQVAADPSGGAANGSPRFA
jgi:hypothetical protein